MIKLVCFLRRAPGMQRDDFHRHWLDRHGPLIAGTPELARHLLRYEQNHRLADDYGRDPQDAPGFDGATVQWLASREAFLDFVREPKYRELIAPDEARFLDRSSLQVFFTGPEEVKIDGDRDAAGLKLLCLLRRRPGDAPGAFHDHWRGTHAALFAGTPEIRRHVLAYHQNHALEGEATPLPGRWDGLAEQWYASREDFEAMLREPRYRESVPEDEERFIDRSDTPFLLCGRPDVVIG